LSRFLRSHVDLVELAPSARIIVVANKLRAAAIGLNPGSQVRQTLSRFGGIESPVLVPHDQSGLDAALLSARTLAEVAPRSPARAAIQELVKTQLLPEPVASGARSRPASPFKRGREARTAS
jgi:Flp pilus assembly CpaE family ATPase